MTPREAEEYRALRATIRERGSLRVTLFVIGMIAWRRVGIGVAGTGLFGLFGAFVAITRPESHVTDVIPSVVGGIVGIAALVWLHSTAARQPGYRPGRAL